MNWFAIAIVFALVLAIPSAYMLRGERKPMCRRCGDRISPEDARMWCNLSKCPHQRAPLLGDIT